MVITVNIMPIAVMINQTGRIPEFSSEPKTRSSTGFTIPLKLFLHLVPKTIEVF